MSNNKLDILAFAAHPDDVELSCGGTLIKHIAMGYSVGIVDLTQGELGTRGTADTRKSEADGAGKIIGISARENLMMSDGFFENNIENKLKIIAAIRKYQPDVVFANAIRDRHIDHGRASSLVEDACFLSGLTKVETIFDNKIQKAWRPKVVYHYIQDRFIIPDFVIDISNHWEHKLKAIRAFKTQFHDPESTEPQTPISGLDFMEFLESRAREFGRYIGAEFGEGFTVSRPAGVPDITKLI